MEDWNKDEQKEAVKEAFREWLDAQAAEFGKWTLKWIARASIGALLYYLVTHGLLK